ncbi:unnamed protein product [Symbiodinium sp. CCMP2592]|nr:unnamed protein product [Symbiodinium sp. CCMP2592]
MAEQLKVMMAQLADFLDQQKAAVPQETWKTMLQTHASAVKQGIGKLVKVTPTEATALTRGIADGPWTGEQKTEMCQLVSDKLAALGGGNPAEETRTQDCPRFGAYLSKEDRRILADPAQSESQKLHQMASRCIKIGLVLPSETCKGRILASAVAGGLEAKTASSFYSALNHFKRIMKRKREMMPGKTTFELPIYPDSPDQLPDHLRHFADSYREDPPEPLSIDQILKVSQVQALRKSSKALQAATSSSSSSALVPSGPSQGDAFGQFMAGLMHVVQAMQNQGQGEDQPLGNLHLFKPNTKRKQLALPSPDKTSQTQAQPLQTDSPAEKASSSGVPLLSLPAPEQSEKKETAEDEEEEQNEGDQDGPEEQLGWLQKCKRPASILKQKPAANIIPKPKVKAVAKTKAVPKSKAVAKSKAAAKSKTVAKSKAVPKAKAASNTIVKSIRKRSGWVVHYRRRGTDGSLYGKWWSPEGQGYPSAKLAAEVLRAVKEADSLPAGISQSSVKRSREKRMAAETPFGPMMKHWKLESNSGAEIPVDFLDPAACLWHRLNSCERFRSFMLEMLERKPATVNSPWGIVVYSDEVSPGNQLKVSNARKLQTFYWSFREFGTSLTREDAWMLLTTVRSKTVADVADGLSQLTKRCMLCFTEEDRNFRFGLAFPGLVLSAELAIVVADESALKHMFEFKGASGKVPCMFCRNVVLRRYAPAPLHPPLELHTCTDSRRFKLHTANSLQATVNLLSSKVDGSSRKDFDAMQSNLGFNHSPHGVLLCQPLMAMFDPTKGVMFDWAHVYLVGGLFHLEVNLLLGRLNQQGVQQDAIHQALQEYSLPSYHEGKSNVIKNVFQPKKGDSDWKSSASEALGVYPILRDIIHRIRETTELSADCLGAISSFLLLCQCLDLLQGTLHGDVAPSDLRTAVEAHLAKYQEVYPGETFLPKGHMAMHLAGQLSHHRILISCLTHERRHKELKRYANNQNCARAGTEKGLLREMELTHLEALDRLSLSFRTELQTPVTAPEPLQRAFANHFELRGASGLLFSSKAKVPRCPLVSTGDIVLLDEPVAVAEVLYHCQLQDYLFTCVSFYEKVADTPNKFRIVEDNASFVSPASIRGPCITRSTADRFIFVVPQHFATR